MVLRDPSDNARRRSASVSGVPPSSQKTSYGNGEDIKVRERGSATTGFSSADLARSTRYAGVGVRSSYVVDGDAVYAPADLLRRIGCSLCPGFASCGRHVVRRETARSRQISRRQ